MTFKLVVMHHTQILEGATYNIVELIMNTIINGCKYNNNNIKCTLSASVHVVM